MPEAKHGIYDALECDLKPDGDHDTEDVWTALQQLR